MGGTVAPRQVTFCRPLVPGRDLGLYWMLPQLQFKPALPLRSCQQKHGSVSF